MSFRNGQRALWRPLQYSAQPAPISSGLPTSISSLAGWWDAGSLDGLVTATGQSLASWNQAVGAIADKSGSGHALSPYSFQQSGTTATAIPRLSGILGGVGRKASGGSILTPPLDPELGFQISNLPTQWSGSWTWYLVWSRPNWRQNSAQDTGAITLLSAGSTPILQIDGSAGTGRLVLFPGTAPTVLSTSMTRRHTHSVVVQSDGTKVSVWVDGISVAANVSLPTLPTGSVTTLLLHDGGPLGSAQCWFHEAAVWPRALTNTEIASLNAYSARWFRGPRKSVVLLINGQSNAINYALNDSAAMLLAQGIAWHLGALSYGVLATTGSSNSYTMQSGHGIYSAVNNSYPGSFVQNPGTGADPSTWALGTDGQAVNQALSSTDTNDLSDIKAIVWPWNETDSLRDFGELSQFTSAAKRFLALERSMIGINGANVPLVWWSAIPYGTDSGMTMHRAAVSAITTDTSQNAILGNPQTADSNARGSSWDPSTGLATGGDIAHRDSQDNQRFARLASATVATAIIAKGGADSISILPSGLPVSGGPKIVHAYRQSNTTIIVQIHHDAGTDLKVPLNAASGVGFAVMDGGSPINPGPIIRATSCSRVDATHLSLSLASPLVNPSASCNLYYPYGNTAIGRGNAVTDNYSNCTKPTGWDIAADLGTAWNLDYPLAAPVSPITLSDVPQ